MKKLLLAIPIIAILAYFGAKLYVQQRAAKSVDTLIQLAAPFATVTYDSISTTMGGELAVDDLDIRFNGFDDVLQIEAIGIELPTFLDLLNLDDFGPGSRAGQSFPEHFEVFVTSARLDVQHDYLKEMLRTGELAAAAKHGGNIPSRADDPLGHCANRYGVTARDLREVELDVVDMSLRFAMHELGGNMAFTAAFEVADYQRIDTTVRFQGSLQDLARGRVSRALLAGFEMVIEDRSAMARAFSRCETLGVDRDTAKELMVTDVLTTLEEMGFVADDRLIDPLREGIAGEHSWFRITGDPSQPVDLNRLNLYKPSDLPALLGVNLESRESAARP